MCFEREREAKSPQAVTRVSNPISCKSPIQGSRQDPAPCRTVKTGVNPGSASPTRAVGRNPCHLQLDLPLKTSSKAAIRGAGGAVVFRGGSADCPGQPRLPWERSWGEQLRKGRWWDYINYFSEGKEKKRKKRGRSLVEDLRSSQSRGARVAGKDKGMPFCSHTSPVTSRRAQFLLNSGWFCV